VGVLGEDLQERIEEGEIPNPGDEIELEVAGLD
jgi:hypothetical protein